MASVLEFSIAAFSSCVDVTIPATLTSARKCSQNACVRVSSAVSSANRNCLKLSPSPFSTSPLLPLRRTELLSVAALDNAEPEVAEEVAEEELEYVGNEDLVMYFKAEGTLAEASASNVIKALEAVEGVSNVKVTVSEGCATAECTKVTTVQATGVASGLVEAIQGAGFVMQTLSLGFDESTEPLSDFFSSRKTEFVDADIGPLLSD